MTFLRTMKKNRIPHSSKYQELKAFMKKILGIEISENTVFFKDFDLIGHDAEEFIIKFSEEFEVDMSDFRFSEYFIDEYKIPFLYWFDVFFNKRKINRKTFDIRHLLNVIDQGKWIEV